MRHSRFAVLILVSLLIPCGMSAQSSASKDAARAQAATPDSEQIRLGNSVVALYGPWKFHTGDSPTDPKTGSPLWSEPAFDDSGWENVDLTPESGATDPISGLSEFVPGWTAKGHPGYWGYAWYRIRVQVVTKPGEQLALAGPSNVDDAYQAFDNGTLVGHFGDFSRAHPVVYFTQPVMFALPESAASAGSPGHESTQVIAFRLWMEPNTLLESNDVGGFHTAPLLGQSGAVTARHQMRWLELIRSYILTPIIALGFGLLSIVACSLLLFDRSDRVYLWIGLVLFISSAFYASICIGSWTQLVGAIPLTILQDVILVPLFYTGWVMVWRVWFRLRRPTWMPGVLAGLVLVLMVSNALGENIFFNLVSQPVSHAFHLTSIGVRLLLALLMLSNVFMGIRDQGLDGWVVLPATLFSAISGFQNELRVLHIRTNWLVFGANISVFFLANLLLVAAVAVLLLRRLLVSMKYQRQMALDVRQAQEVQQVILPEGQTTLPGLVIESEYRPAHEVGGDFFQIIPNRTDGSLLIVAGDVAGKGLKAGMLVALLVGAIRSTAELNSEPEFVLQALNRRLMGRGDAQATCLALRIEADGAVTLANAGHMPPYLNGDSLPIEGTLPLGMIEGAEISVMRFNLKEADRLVLMSDGVVEATNAEGRLFGFERVHQLLETASTAAEVARVAQNFGQADDISVIAVTRTAVLEPALA
ncbi:MAG: SpoIIE family protein phosphatase [Terracidiphilus sp.]